ncbi:hypothetical protein PGT21_022865 [Puccinia graminis f. sp. tritici]|uniref:Uncharacterized protein n=1 Tax=Puccinia graminis f. sp. tritici TaxID=56615 RepID=A0A5B0MM13_PUCGR|nr:hypothetical protein PGT21_022865 [Puccinia graminis f. sp. tritici]KAA1078857.1 hypothetical protein PGTUg99_009863 [Puccinia graminis f. sp. tritici]
MRGHSFQGSLGLLLVGEINFFWKPQDFQIANHNVHQSHPAARRFRNQPFPEWHDLLIIFVTAATGAKHQSLGQGGSQQLARNDSQTSDTDNRQRNRRESNSDEEDDSGTQQRRRKRNRQTTGAAFGGAIRELIDAFAPPDQSQNTTESQIPDRMSNNQIVSRAVEVFQDGLAHELSMEELVCGFSVLENPSKARMFIRIEDSYKGSWLRHQIRLHQRAST